MDLLSKSKDKKKGNRNEPRYHGPLITAGVNLGYLKFYPWLNVFFTGIFYYWALIEESPSEPKVISLVFLLCLIINIVSLLFSFFNSLINRFKALSFGLIALVTFTMLIWIDYIGLILFVAKGETIYLSMLKESPLSFVYIILICLVSIISSLIYGSYYLDKSKRKKWSFNQLSKDQKKTNFFVIFVCVIFIPTFLIGKTIVVFALIYGVFLNATLPAVIVDAIYAAYCVRKYPGRGDVW